MMLGTCDRLPMKPSGASPCVSELTKPMKSGLMDVLSKMALTRCVSSGLPITRKRFFSVRFDWKSSLPSRMPMQRVRLISRASQIMPKRIKALEKRRLSGSKAYSTKMMPLPKATPSTALPML